MFPVGSAERIAFVVAACAIVGCHGGSKSDVSAVGGMDSAGGTAAEGGQAGASTVTSQPNQAGRSPLETGGTTSDAGSTSVETGGTTIASAGYAGSGGVAGFGGAATNLPKHIIGADITITLEDEFWGATYSDQGTLKPLEQLLKDHGFNFIRIAAFVNPGASDGYSVGKPQNFRDLDHTIALAKRVKAIGLGSLLALHYSDTWANPGQQTTPVDWSSLELNALSDRVASYTTEALTQLSAANATPDIVQVGNEITNGMLWNVGKVANNNFSSFATLLKSGIQAVRDFDPKILVMVQIEKCNNFATTKWWLDGVLQQGVAFDILGQSCYSAAPNGVAGYQGTPAEWTPVFNQLAAQYPQLRFMIAEYSADQRAAHETMHQLPDGRGLGAFNWDPTRSYSTHPNYPLFTTDGVWNRFVAIPELMAIYDDIASQYGLR